MLYADTTVATADLKFFTDKIHVATKMVFLQQMANFLCPLFIVRQS